MTYWPTDLVMYDTAHSTFIQGQKDRRHVILNASAQLVSLNKEGQHECLLIVSGQLASFQHSLYFPMKQTFPAENIYRQIPRWAPGATEEKRRMRSQLRNSYSTHATSWQAERGDICGVVQQKKLILCARRCVGDTMTVSLAISTLYRTTYCMLPHDCSCLMCQSLREAPDNRVQHVYHAIAVFVPNSNSGRYDWIWLRHGKA